jgi:hypothetical protein
MRMPSHRWFGSGQCCPITAQHGTPGDAGQCPFAAGNGRLHRWDRLPVIKIAQQFAESRIWGTRHLTTRAIVMWTLPSASDLTRPSADRSGGVERRAAPRRSPLFLHRQGRIQGQHQRRIAKPTIISPHQFGIDLDYRNFPTKDDNRQQVLQFLDEIHDFFDAISAVLPIALLTIKAGGLSPRQVPSFLPLDASVPGTSCNLTEERSTPARR